MSLITHTEKLIKLLISVLIFLFNSVIFHLQ